MGQQWSNLFPPAPRFTEENLSDQKGKVFIITGSSGGIGKQLAAILYGRNATVYVATRSKQKAESAISEISQTYPDSKGQLIFLHLDLGDLTTIRKSAEEFLKKESRLDVLWNNAGVMVPPAGSKTAQGYELQLGTNNIGHFLFTHFLRPVLKQTAESSPKGSVRVVWVSSSMAEIAPKPAIDFSNMDYHRDENQWRKYARSKAGNVLHACEFARQVKKEGIISVSLNPGNLITDLQRTMPKWQLIFVKLIAHDSKFGAYTELFAGLHPEITEEKTGSWIAPFGRLSTARGDLLDPALGKRYWEWTNEQVQTYL
ncbi:hypothetical protein C8Q69DRAFT_466861 [Paecilomyces variotii]|uniref:Short-chain dehydrogenase n=1 Tax=Byssochlamys spectabilis TaxID=264951 RepID=A0A443HUX4_BYSSP|nr:hypothetical protein C8Q69DRAFT_466861 [Paecilomyces variotii]KAJ9360160.1 hypothetical protein DTO280E4_4382 [Paecilomyces variotii]RWQ95643.1 hypothetical protein C8Q69DRAFT_466861 [Paecilomyces variotii]